MADSKVSTIATRVIAGVLTAGAVWAASLIPGALEWVSASAASIWSHLKGTSSLPNWSLYLLFMMSIPSVFLVINRMRKDKGPHISQYTEDSFFGVTWRWHYSFGNSPTNIWAFCPHCETMLVYGYEYPFNGDRTTVLTCETCSRPLLHNRGDRDYLVAKVHRQIDRNLRTGAWKNAFPSTSPP
jgi:ribosomal protein S27E